jgi:hypothetical protein
MFEYFKYSFSETGVNIFFFIVFYIYSHVYTLFGLPPPILPSLGVNILIQRSFFLFSCGLELATQFCQWQWDKHAWGKGSFPWGESMVINSLCGSQKTNQKCHMDSFCIFPPPVLELSMGFDLSSLSLFLHMPILEIIFVFCQEGKTVT